MVFDEKQLGEVYRTIREELIWLHAYDDAFNSMFADELNVEMWNKLFIESIHDSHDVE